MSPRSILSLSILTLMSCDGGTGLSGQDGQQGQAGQQGPQGPAGPQGPPGPAGPGDRGSSDTAGTRLKMYKSVFTADDGTKITTPSYVYRDTVLNLDCTFQTAADGKQRCLPTYNAADIVSASATPAFFADSGCTRGLQFVLKPCAPITYLLLVSTGTACPASNRSAVYSTPSPTTPTALYVGAPGSCSSVGDISPYLKSYAFFDLSGATPISPGQFVGGTTTQVL